MREIISSSAAIENGASGPLHAYQAESGKPPIPYAWSLVLWLWLAHFLNQADRQVYSVVLPQLSSELHLSAVQAGLVAGLFTVSLALCVPLAGWAGDRFDRKQIIVLSLAAWSASTVLSGLATGIGMLIAVRSVASAAGEAFYTPAAYALMGSYHSKTRSRAMSLHQTALYVGIISSGFLAGWIADHWGWRQAFLVFGLAGILLAGVLKFKLLPAPPPSKVAATERSHFLEAVAMLVRTPTFWWLSLAFGCLAFVNAGYLTWMPTYLHERFQLSLAKAGFIGMFWHHAAALGGVMAGGALSDRMARSKPVRRIDLQGLGLFLGAPFLFLLGQSEGLVSVVMALIGFGLFRGLYDSNIYPSLFEVVPQRYHSTASGLMISCAFLFGAIAPVVLGSIKETMGLAAGFSLLSVVYVIGAVGLWAGGHRCFAADHSRAQAANLIWRTQP